VVVVVSGVAAHPLCRGAQTGDGGGRSSDVSRSQSSGKSYIIEERSFDCERDCDSGTYRDPYPYRRRRMTVIVPPSRLVRMTLSIREFPLDLSPLRSVVFRFRGEAPFSAGRGRLVFSASPASAGWRIFETGLVPWRAGIVLLGRAAPSLPLAGSGNHG
jgi:hypothetical protein